jgi:hypothetical protein
MIDDHPLQLLVGKLAHVAVTDAMVLGRLAPAAAAAVPDRYSNADAGLRASDFAALVAKARKRGRPDIVGCRSHGADLHDQLSLDCLREVIESGRAHGESTEAADDVVLVVRSQTLVRGPESIVGSVCGPVRQRYGNRVDRDATSYDRVARDADVMTFVVWAVARDIDRPAE